MKKIYISGKITGDPDYLEKFARAERLLEQKGFEPVNPCKDEETGHEWEWYMKRDIVKMLECSAVYLLPDWKRSKGARIECALAKDLGLEFVGIQPFITTKEERRLRVNELYEQYKQREGFAEKQAEQKRRYYEENREELLQKIHARRYATVNHKCWIADNGETKKAFWTQIDLAKWLGYSKTYISKAALEGIVLQGYQIKCQLMTGPEMDDFNEDQKK